MKISLSIRKVMSFTVLSALVFSGCASVLDPSTEHLVIYAPPFSGDRSCSGEGTDLFILSLQRELDSWVKRGKGNKIAYQHLGLDNTWTMADAIGDAKGLGADIIIIGTVNIIKKEDYPTNGSSTVKVYDVTKFEILEKFESSDTVGMGLLPIPPPDVDYCHSVLIAVRKTANEVIDFIKWDYADKY